jgi:hypothetical protein
MKREVVSNSHCLYGPTSASGSTIMVTGKCVAYGSTGTFEQ